ncbi:MAG TPA: hypothetical protein VH374_23635 [Polyangia bacterium]|nr:hypothetical protein [Polyangia bacterium]
MGWAHTAIKPGDTLQRHLRNLVGKTITLRLSDGTDLTGRTRFVAKDCMLFEETPGAPLVTVSLEHVVTVRLSD